MTERWSKACEAAKFSTRVQVGLLLKELNGSVQSLQDGETRGIEG